MTYRIFDSLDRPTGPIKAYSHELQHDLDVLTMEAEEEGSRLTYAIGKVLPDVTITFDY